MSYSPHELAAPAASAALPPRGDMTIEEMIALYRDIRDVKIAQLKERHEAEMAPYVQVKALLEQAIRNEMLRTGVESFKTAAGTAFQKTNSSYTVEDPSAFRAWLEETGMYLLLDTRVSKSALEEFMQAHPTLPPGIKVRSETVVQVRK